VNKNIRFALLSFCALILFMGLLFWGYLNPKTSQPPTSSQLLNTAEIFVENEKGESLSLSQSLGSADRPLYLSFWATWCAPCLKEIPLILKSAVATKARLVFISLDSGSFLDRQRKVNEWRKNYAVDIQTLFDFKGDLSEFFEISALPRNILLSQEGKVLWSFEGLMDERTLKTAVEKLDGL
jgi:thiol-disulfide isomerase/thioredoxin